MARAADFDLANELAKPSFTPGRGDARALVELVVGADEPSATRAATALAKLGEVARTTIEGRLRTTADPAGVLDEPRGRTRPVAPAPLDDAGRARLVGALGLLARAGDAIARGELIARLADDSVRVRRAAVNSLGKLASGEHPAAELDDVRAALLARWDATDAPPDERRALAEALGKVGGEAALARLRALDTAGDGELARRRDRALLMADRTARRGDDSEIATDVP
ncbi:MAG TPA: hypothetical protein VIU61_19290, partial [Kofleriaceae bacterium]